MEGNGRRRFEGRVVVVTGGASGLGEAMSKAFAAEGGRVAVADIREEGAQKVAGEADGEARGYVCDVSDPAAVRSLFEAVASDFGDVDVLVNNAGIARRNQPMQEKWLEQVQAAMTGGERESLGATQQLSDEDWDRMLRIHLYGTFYCTREALKVMERNRRGVMVNISSVAALQGLPGAPDYSAAKAGIIGITRAVAAEVSGSGIRVNAIAPGWIRTPMVQEEIDPRLLPILLAQVPLGGMGEPEHIAALALHLCSDEASYTTGQVISPNGGLHPY